MNRKTSRQLLTLSLILCMVFAFGTIFKICAGEQEKRGMDNAVTIKVAFCTLDGFFEYDENGKECGYGVDYLNEIAKYASVEMNYEYVPVDSWEEIKKMMDAGQVDVKMPTSEPITTSDEYNYTTESMITTYHAIMTSVDRSDLYYEDYEKLRNITIAVSKDLLGRTGMEDYLTSIGATDNIVYFDEYNQCKEALDTGKVDAVVSNIMDLTDDLKILAKFGVIKNYITTLEGNDKFLYLNDAITNMKLNEPSFQADLYETYYPRRAQTPFTKEEMELIENVDKLIVAVYDNKRPISYYDEETEEFSGLAVELMRLMGDKIGIEFVFVPVTTKRISDMLTTGQADLCMPMSAESQEAYFQSDSIFDTSIKFAVLKGNEYPEAGARVGYVSDYEDIRKTLDKEGEDYILMGYADSNAALQALKAKDIHAFATSSHNLEYTLENPKYTGISILQYQNLPMEYCLCGKTNETLQSIIDKGIKKVTKTEFEQILSETTQFKWESLSFWDRMYVYRIVFFSIGILVWAVICIFLIYNNRRSRYIRQIEQKSKELEKASNAKTDFLSSMSHEIRTPMNAILGMATLAKDAQSVEEKDECVGQILESSNYLLQIINDILDMSRIESQHVVLSEKYVYGPEFLEAIRSMMDVAAAEENITLEADFTETKASWFRMDSLRSKQIYVNLINNAIKFSPKGSTIKWIIKDVPLDENHVHMICTIADEGCGMSEEFQKKMFYPFEQERNQFSDKTPGTGLGLAIVKNLVGTMGGTITCESKINVGTTFTIEMDREINSVNPESEKEIKEKKPVQLEGKKILLAEDNDINAKVTARMLEKYGMKLTRVNDGAEALKVFKESSLNEYDGILMDIRMPNMDGLEATKRIRALARGDARTIPIIAMTADAFSEDMDKTKEAGMNAHLSKPIEQKLFIDTLHKYL